MTDPLSDQEFNTCLRAILSLPRETLLAGGTEPDTERFVPAQMWADRTRRSLTVMPSQERTTYYVDFVDPSSVLPGDSYTTWVITRQSDSSELEITCFRSRVRTDGQGHDTIPPTASQSRTRWHDPGIGEQHLGLLVLRCGDLQLSRSFYIALGFDLCRQRHGDGPIHYSAQRGPTLFELYPKGTSAIAPLRIGLTVPLPPHTLVAVPRCGGAVVRDAVATTGSRVALLKDPDGNLLEVRIEV